MNSWESPLVRQIHQAQFLIIDDKTKSHTNIQSMQTQSRHSHCFQLIIIFLFCVNKISFVPKIYIGKSNIYKYTTYLITQLNECESILF